jgi:hypothetical protein
MPRLISIPIIIYGLKNSFMNYFVKLPRSSMQKTNSLTFALYITDLSMHQIQLLALGVLPYHEEGPRFVRYCIVKGDRFYLVMVTAIEWALDCSSMNQTRIEYHDSATWTISAATGIQSAIQEILLERGSCDVMSTG